MDFHNKTSVSLPRLPFAARAGWPWGRQAWTTLMLAAVLVVL
jgi:hypothetical protein